MTTVTMMINIIQTCWHSGFCGVARLMNDLRIQRDAWLQRLRYRCNTKDTKYKYNTDATQLQYNNTMIIVGLSSSQYNKLVIIIMLPIEKCSCLFCFVCLNISLVIFLWPDLVDGMLWLFLWTIKHDKWKHFDFSFQLFFPTCCLYSSQKHGNRNRKQILHKKWKTEKEGSWKIDDDGHHCCNSSY